MTNRERCIQTLLCERTDRAPWVSWLGFEPWGLTLKRWKQESGIADLDVPKYFGLETFFLVPPARMGPVPSFDFKLISETDAFVVSTGGRMNTRAATKRIRNVVALSTLLLAGAGGGFAADASVMLVPPVPLGCGLPSAPARWARPSGSLTAPLV